jgi:nucleoid DNA-binding protein
MNREEQLKDIQNRTGISSTIIREVWRGTRESLIARLKKGETCNIYGICSLKTSDRVKLDTDGRKEYKTIQVKASTSLVDDVNTQDIRESGNEDNGNYAQLSILDKDVLEAELSILK